MTIKTFLYFITISTCCIACNRSIDNTQVIIHDDIPFYIDCQTMQHIVEQGIDSQIGTIICNDVKLHYEYGRYSSNQPQSYIEYFSKSFYAYHYSKFFDAVYIDERLRESFKDSVQIVDVKAEILDKKYVIECLDHCNATAILRFKKADFYYPFVLDQEIINTQSDYNISQENISGEYYKKVYLANNHKMSGVYIAPLGNPKKNRQKSKLSLTTNQAYSKKLDPIFESINLKSDDDD